MTQRGSVTVAQYRAKSGRYKRVPYPQFKYDEPCASVGVDMFYPPDGTPDSEIREINKVLTSLCATCPMQNPCLTWALHREIHGFWGGTSSRMRAELRKEMGIGVCSVELLDGYLEQQESHDKEAMENVQTQKAD